MRLILMTIDRRPYIRSISHIFQPIYRDANTRTDRYPKRHQYIVDDPKPMLRDEDGA